MRDLPTPCVDSPSPAQAPGGPILFCDTCAILDIIRIPHRTRDTKQAIAYFDAINAILTEARAGRVRLVAHELVNSEWHANAAKVKAETESNMADVQRMYSILYEISRRCGAPGPAFEHLKANVGDDLYTQSQSVLDICNAIPDRDDSLLRATKRASQFIPPATKGGIKDCVIYEHILAFASDIRNTDTNSKFIFISSNTNDYCSIAAQPHVDIAAELNALGISFCANWSHAWRLVTSP